MKSQKTIMPIIIHSDSRVHHRANLSFLSVLLLLNFSLSAPVSEETLLRKKMATSFCNVEFKQTFIEPDFTFLTNTPQKAENDIKSICPFVTYTCCTANELQAVVQKFKNNMGTLNSYFETLKENLGKSLIVKRERLRRIFDQVHSGIGENDSVTNRVCQYGFQGTKREARFQLHNLHTYVRFLMSEIDNVRNLIERFYSGFVCSVCDMADHQHVRVNDVDRLTSMTFDPNICEPVFKIRYKHYQVVSYVLDIFDLVNSLLCMSSRSAKSFIYFMKLRQELARKTQMMERCIPHSDNDAEDMSRDCLKTCAEKLFFQQYIDNFDLLTLTNFIKVFMNSVKRGRLRRAARKELQAHLYFAVDFTFKQSSKRRTFHLNQPRFQNLFSNEQFRRRFKSNAINFMNKAPIL